MMLNKRGRWFHSSRENFPLVSMSASWCLVTTNLIWILGSKFILSKNQSRATLWVLDTCLIVGLRPLIIILMTVSLSSKMYNWDPPWEESVFVGTWSACDNWSLINVSVSLLFGFKLSKKICGIEIWTAAFIGADMNILQINMLVLCASIPQRWCIFCKIHLFLCVIEDFLQVPRIGDLHILEF